jgi:NADH-quinone oxidoreductase subunit A
MRRAYRCATGPAPGKEGCPRLVATVAARAAYRFRENDVLGEYLPILLFLIVSTGIGIVLLIVGNLLGPKRPGAEKLSPYECGFEAFDDARMKFDVRYYLIAILFIVFDLEIAFMFPWAVVFKELGGVAIGAMAMFLGILVVGFVYEWKKGALDWE